MPVDAWRIGGTRVDAVTHDDVYAFVDERVRSRVPGQIVTVNAEYVVRAVDDPDFARVVEEADLATPDGAGVVWAIRRRGACVPRRVGGSDLIWDLSEQAAGAGYRVFLLGAGEGVAAIAAERLRERFPHLQIAGTFSGSPATSEEIHISDLIQATGADILFVAFGAPLQDIWIARNLRRTGVAVAIGVGGSFDYVAGTARRAPVWMRERGLEWLWRLIRQPYRWRRMLALPRFVWLVWRNERQLPATERMDP